MDRKEYDNLREIEEKEQLQRDCAYIQNIKNSIRNTSINRLEELRKEYIQKNQLKVSEMIIINRFVEYLKEKA